jgi:hypothetical protein
LHRQLVADGTGSGRGLLGAWNDAKGNNRELFLNASEWLAHSSGY